MRKIYERIPISPELTQGSIINNCVASDYITKDIFGCVVTPRCDLARGGKVSTIHYLPIVNFGDWFLIEGRTLIADIIKKEAKGRLNKTLLDYTQISNALDRHLSKQNILTIAEDKIKKVEELKKFKNDIELYFSINKDTLTEFPPKDKLLRTILKRLIDGDHHSFYLLDNWIENEPPKIILLRDIRRISISIANQFKSGFTVDDISKEELLKNDLQSEVAAESVFSIQAQIKSPFIEHILQSFSYNFSRIGVEDLDSEQLCDILFEHSKSILS